MEIVTRRFGPIQFHDEDILFFPAGLLGLEQCRKWVLLADARNDGIAWLQCIERPEVALAVVSPRRFVQGYRIRVARRELESLELKDVSQAQVLVVVGKTDRALTVNLKAPVIINLERRLGRQVITNGDLPVQHELAHESAALRKTA